MSQVVDDSLQAARDAAARHAWRQAVECFTEAERSTALPPGDLEVLGMAAWWTGRLDRCIEARERAFTAYLDAGNRRRAGMMAVRLAVDYTTWNQTSVAAGWAARAHRVLADEPESPEHGYLSRLEMFGALGKGDAQAALEHARRTVAIGTRTGDRDVLALGLHDEGSVLVGMGQVDEGWALMEEATVAAVSGELDPWTTAAIFCNTITACRDIADYRRAGEWAEAAKRWCERQAIAGFPGMCRVYRAEVMRLRGAWIDAEREARQACEELREFNMRYAASALYEVGEIRLRVGDLASAADAFEQAHELGHEAQPGLALLRLADGKADSASASIRSALEETVDRLARARLLPAQVDIAVAAGDLEAARAAADELEGVAAAYGTGALRAAADMAGGAVALAVGDPAAARAHLKAARQRWQDIDLPYEAARTRMLLADAWRAEGDEEAARMELRAARTAFERLGAVPDARRAAELLGEEGGTSVAAAGPERTRKAFLFTDIVRSTNLLEAIGDDAWGDVVGWHDRTLRALFASHGGQEVDHAGDGFFVAFDDPEGAVDCAVAIQRALAEHRRTHGFAPPVRIGIHAAGAVRAGSGYRGKGVHQAARIGGAAGGGEILVSEETVEGIRLRHARSDPRDLELKGIPGPVRVVAVDWR